MSETTRALCQVHSRCLREAERRLRSHLFGHLAWSRNHGAPKTWGFVGEEPGGHEQWGLNLPLTKSISQGRGEERRTHDPGAVFLSLGSSADEAIDDGAGTPSNPGVWWVAVNMSTQPTFKARANCGGGFVSCWETGANSKFSTILRQAVVRRILMGFS